MCPNSDDTNTLLSTIETADPTGLVGKAHAIYNLAKSLFGGNTAAGDRKKKISDFLYPGGVGETMDALVNSLLQQAYLNGRDGRKHGSPPYDPPNNMMDAIAYWQQLYSGIKDTSLSDTVRNELIDKAMGKAGAGGAYEAQGGVIGWITNYAIPIVISWYDVNLNPAFPGGLAYDPDYVAQHGTTPGTAKPGTGGGGSAGGASITESGGGGFPLIPVLILIAVLIALFAFKGK
jgi:hypothetical protein